MKTLKAILIVIVIGFAQNGNAQFFKKLGKRVEEVAKETVNQKIENKTAEKTGDAMDTILNSDKKIKKIGKKEKNHAKKKNKKSSENEATNSEREVNSNMDFESGYDAIFTDTFKNDAIGDFPVTWNTNSSGEVVTFDEDETRWLQLDVGEYTLDGITEIPDNCTFEFDLTVNDYSENYAGGILVNIIAVKNRKKDFLQWTNYGYHGNNGVRLRLNPKNIIEQSGETSIQTYIDNEEIIGNTKNNDLFTMDNSTAHVALWRQKNRLRVYLNNEKVWDIARAFGDANYNAISFNTVIRPEEHFYVSNLRLAVASEDTRHPLLETGRFETNDILFDVNKAVIKSSSFSVLDDLGKVLEENPSVRIKIIGHTDSDGSAEANQILSEQRAASIKDYLSTNFSVEGTRMQIVGKGESEPIESNATPQGKAKNRRVEFIKM